MAQNNKYWRFKVL